jgi:hypothetical protein
MSRIKVSHEFGDIPDHEGKILVMRDKGILEDSDDEAIEVENIEMAEEERRDAQQRRAKHGKRFNPYEDDWEAGQQETMLSKYDDFDELEKSRRLGNTIELEVGKEAVISGRAGASSKTLDEGYNPSEEFPSTMTVGSTVRARAALMREADDTVKIQSDFYTKEEAVGFRKVSKPDKKKKRKKTDEDEPETRPTKVQIDFNVTAEEDEELYSHLSRLRRMHKDRVRPMNEEEIAQTILASRNQDQHPSGVGVADFLSRVVPTTVEQEPEPVPGTHEVVETEETVVESTKMVDEVSAPEPPKPQSSTTADIKVDSGLACALQLFASRGEMKPKEDGGKETEKDAKEAYRKLNQDFHKRRQHQKRYKQSKT